MKDIEQPVIVEPKKDKEGRDLSFPKPKQFGKEEDIPWDRITYVTPLFLLIISIPQPPHFFCLFFFNWPWSQWPTTNPQWLTKDDDIDNIKELWQRDWRTQKHECYNIYPSSSSSSHILSLPLSYLLDGPKLLNICRPCGSAEETLERSFMGTYWTRTFIFGGSEPCGALKSLFRT